MTQRLIFILLGLSGLSCDTKENAALKAENDSLLAELVLVDSSLAGLNDVSSLLNALNQNEQLLDSGLEKGISLEKLKNHLTLINTNIKRTDEKLTSIRVALKNSENRSGTLLDMVSSLQDELQASITEAEALEDAVQQYKIDKQGLIKRGSVQEEQLLSMKSQLAIKQQELLRLQVYMDDLVASSEITEAEAYYARATSVEKAADRTRLAARKKRETYQEALELYKKAIALGKAEAQSNAEALEKKLKLK